MYGGRGHLPPQMKDNAAVSDAQNYVILRYENNDTIVTVNKIYLWPYPEFLKPSCKWQVREHIDFKENNHNFANKYYCTYNGLIFDVAEMSAVMSVTHNGKWPSQSPYSSVPLTFLSHALK